MDNSAGYPLLSMASAPCAPILALHYERGPMLLIPFHEANYWMSHIDGVQHWSQWDNEEGGMFDDGEFDGWLTTVEV